MNKLLFALMVLLVASIPACNSPQRGVVVTNPGLGGKKLRLTPATGNESYLVTFNNDSYATVGRGRVNDEEVVIEQSVTTAYSYSNGAASVEASFSEDLKVTVELAVDNSASISDASLKVNGRELTSTFSESRCSSSASFDNPEDLSCFLLLKNVGNGVPLVVESPPGSLFQSLDISQGRLTMAFNTTPSCNPRWGNPACQGIPSLSKKLESGDFEIEADIVAGLSDPDPADAHTIGLLVHTIDAKDTLLIDYRAGTIGTSSARNDIEADEPVSVVLDPSTRVSSLSFKIKRMGAEYALLYKLNDAFYVSLLNTPWKDASGNEVDPESLYISIFGYTADAMGAFAPVIDRLNFISGSAAGQE